MQESEETSEENEQTPNEPSETQAGDKPWENPKVDVQKHSWPYGA